MAMVGGVRLIGCGERIGLVKIEPAPASSAGFVGGSADVYAHSPRLNHGMRGPGARVHVDVHLALEALHQAIEVAGKRLVGAV